MLFFTYAAYFGSFVARADAVEGEQHETGGVVPAIVHDGVASHHRLGDAHGPRARLRLGAECDDRGRAGSERGAGACASSRRRSVDGGATPIQAVHMLEDVALGDAVEVAVDHTDVVDRRVGKAAEVQPVLTLLTADVADLDVARNRRERALVALLVRRSRSTATAFATCPTVTSRM